MSQVPTVNVNDQIAEIWSQVLDVRDPSYEATFFDLGGHSLLAIRVMARVQERFGVDLPLAALFQHPTITEFGRYLEGLPTNGDRNASTAIEPAPVPASPQPAQPSLETLLARIDQLSSDEAAQLLELLDRDQGGGGS